MAWIILSFQSRRQQIIFSFLLCKCCRPQLLVVFPGHFFYFFPLSSFSLFVGQIFCTEGGFSFCNIITDCNPLAIVKNLVQQPNLICRKFRLKDGREIRAFLSAAPAHEEFCAVTVG